MREIKFRAWSNNRNEMWTNAHFVPSFGQMCDSDKFVVMQYTGLKDKNEKEIYEGDIVLENRRGIHKSWACKEVISWDEKRSGFTPFCLPRYNSDQYCEVIGNIYENPELLEAK